MRYSNPTAARGAYHDRSAVNVTRSYNALNVAPHGLTVRASYTVPAYHIAMIDLVSLATMRNTVATTPAVYQAFLRYTPSAGSPIDMLQCATAQNSTNVFTTLNLSGAGVLLPGDVIELLTTDGSTGGTVHYNAILKILQFLA